MSNVFNFRDPLRCGYIKLKASGYEKYGTVIKSGYMAKTVTVRVDSLTYINKTKKFLNFAKKFHVHDEDSICRVGDKVVIRVCRPISKHKHYYIRNIVWMGHRQNFYYKDLLEYEKRALLYNKNLRRNFQYSLNNFEPNERI